MSVQNGHIAGIPPPAYTVEKEPVSDMEAGPLPAKTPLDDDVVIVSAEALPTKADFQDPWKSLSGLDKKEGKSWADTTCMGKIWSVTWVTLRIILVFTFLYFFIIALDIMGSAFQLISGRTAGSVLGNSALMENKVAAMMIGVLVTVLLQSSSSTTSITVTMVGAGMLTVKQSIPILMGANIGTSVTSTIVSLAQSTDKETFRRAFAGSACHNVFNWLTIMVLLPIEAAFNMLYYMTSVMVEGVQPNLDTTNPQFLNVITDPLVDLIVDIDRSVIAAIAMDTDRQSFPLPEFYCKEVTETYTEIFPPGATNLSFIDTIRNKQFSFDMNQTELEDGSTYFRWTEVIHDKSELCTHLFTGCGTEFGSLSEPAGGTILLIISLFMMIVCLVMMVKMLNSLLGGPAAKVTYKLINANFPGKLSWLTGYVTILVGAVLTILVQSSSVFTSAMVPLCGMGIISLDRMYPLALGSNIGTTFTSLLAAFTASPETIRDTLQTSLCHLFINLIGIAIFYPVPFMRNLSIRAAKFLGNTTAQYRWFAVGYLLVLFIFGPALLIGLSMASMWAMLAVVLLIVLIIIAVIVINVMQNRCPNALPKCMRTWDFMPLFCRSLEPYDQCITVCCKQKCCQKCCKSCSESISQTGHEDDILYIVSDDVLDPKSPDHMTPSEMAKSFAEVDLTDESQKVHITSISNGRLQGHDNAAFSSIDVQDAQTRL